MKTLFIFIISLVSIVSFSQKIDIQKKYSNIVDKGFKTFYKDGVQNIRYIENGISLSASFDKINTYGDYYQLNIEIINQTGEEFTFFPSKIVTILEEYKIDKKTNQETLKDQKYGEMLSSEDYLKKINNKQFWTKFGSSLTLNSRARMAGQTSSRTETNVSGSSIGTTSGNTTINANKVNKLTSSSSSVSSSLYSASGVSTTESFNGQAAYQAQKEVDQEMKQRNFELNQIKNVLNQGYLKTNTIENGQKILGFININKDDANKVQVLIPVNGKNYHFVFDVEEK